MKAIRDACIVMIEVLPQCGAVNVLARLGVNSKAVQRGLQLRAGTEKAQPLGQEYSNAIRAHQLLEFARDMAQELRKPGYACVGTEHLLLSVLNDLQFTGPGSAPAGCDRQEGSMGDFGKRRLACRPRLIWLSLAASRAMSMVRE
jgi:hypothetical protein